jgi:glycosyltransferase involved in cell wall biosynthesis
VEKIKLLFVIDVYKDPYAGTEGQLLKLISGLDKNKYSARMLVFKNSAYLNNNEFPIPVDVLNISRIISIRSIFLLYQYFKKQKKKGFKIAHIFFNDASIICPPILKLLGYKILISRRDMGYWYTFFNLLLLKINAIYVDKVMVNSEAVKKVTMAKESYPSKRIEVIYNGYQPVDLVGGNQTLNDEMRGWFKEDGFRLVLVANIRPIKRISDAIYAVHKLREKMPSIELYIIGDGSQINLESLADELGIKERISFLGSRDDVLTLLPNFDVGLLCSESEGFSNTLIEYSQAGLPIICSNVGGNAEIVDHGQNGFLYSVGEVDSLAEYIFAIRSDPILQKNMGMAGKEKVENNYGLSKTVNLQQAVYEELLS